MKTNKDFPNDCGECDYTDSCAESWYGNGKCKFKKEIREFALYQMGFLQNGEQMKNKVEDVVNEPNHYKNGSFETIDEMIIVFGIEDTIKFCRMNAWKYRARAPFKGNMEQDMAKANCYLEMAASLEAIRNKDFELLKGGKPNET